MYFNNTIVMGIIMMYVQLDDYIKGETNQELYIFERAGEIWGISDIQIHEDLIKYIKYSEMPFYVRDYVRRINGE